MNNVNDLLNAIQIEQDIETDIKQQILDKRAEIEADRIKVKEEWDSFIAEAFPNEVILLICRYCYSRININGLSIEVATYNKSISFSYREPTGHSYGMHYVNGETCNHYLCDSLNNVNVKDYPYTARSLNEYHKLLQIVKDNLAQIYNCIVNGKQRQVDEEKSRLETIMNNKIEQPKKKYKIEIIVEE